MLLLKLKVKCAKEWPNMIIDGELVKGLVEWKQNSLMNPANDGFVSFICYDKKVKNVRARVAFTVSITKNPVVTDLVFVAD